MEHQFQAITMEDLDVVPDPEDDRQVVALPKGEKDERVGCKVCYMPLDEALELPCPGRPLESMLAD